MCGKFTAMASWSEVVDFSDASTNGGGEGENDHQITFRMMGDLAVIVYDQEAEKRRVVPMRWS